MEELDFTKECAYIERLLRVLDTIPREYWRVVLLNVGRYVECEVARPDEALR